MADDIILRDGNPDPITEYTYPSRMHWIDSEGYNRAGGYYEVSGQMYYNEDAYFKRVILDGTDTDIDHQNRATLFEFNNGIKLVCDYYVAESGSSMAVTYYNIFGTTHLLGPDGAELSEPIELVQELGSFNLGTSTISTDWHGLSSINMYYTPTYLDFWDGDDDATYAYVYGAVITRSGPNGDILGNISYADFTNNASIQKLGSIHTQSELDAFYEALKESGDGADPKPKPSDSDTDTEGGGSDEGDYDPTSDPINFPGLPTVSAIDTGFIRVYNPTAAELRALAGEMWSDGFIQTIKKLQNDPFEALISLHMVPFAPTTGTRALFHLGNYEATSSAVTVSAQYYQINCGSIGVGKYYGTALDYGPYTTCDAYIPFVGVQPLQIDDVMGKTLTLKYNVDVLTGSAVAMLMCGSSVLYTWNTTIISHIPMTGSNMTQMYQAIMSAAIKTAGAAAIGGAGGAAVGAVGALSAADVALSKQTQVTRGGSLSSVAGILADYQGYLILHRPKQSLASGFSHQHGFPSNMGGTLGEYSGYTVVDSVHLKNISGTDAEKSEIESLLKSGVII